ncbi:MAG: hypothetical protein IJB85_04450 [Clostridia bacterium]|nr:hypothetical protein [Clostridia bacterium]
MGKKIGSIAALWLILAALVLIYTNRGEYTWSFDGEETAQVMISGETAALREAQAQAAMAREKAEARERTMSGDWGKADQYGGAPKTRPAVDGELGMNLMWGAYEAEISYTSPQALDVRVVSALRDSFIAGGHAQLAPGEGTEVLPFELTDACERVTIACDLPQGAQIHGVTVRRADTGVISRDLAAYAAFAGVVLTALLVLTWDRRPNGRARRRDALIVVLMALFASMPLLWKGIYDGHDLFFHLARIEGIASGLRAGQFPVRIHASTLLGYGYAAPQFYPELFLYIPAALRLAGVSLAGSVRLFEIMINFATAAVCYMSARGMLRSRRIALGAAMLYTLCSYRIANMYVRATMGESLAMIFFPLLLWAAYEVFAGDEKKWPLMALAMTGIFMSHLLSTLFAVGLCALGALICVVRLVHEPRRILACAKAAGVMLLCSMWFLVPFLSYSREGISTSVAVMASEHVLRPGALLVGFAGAAKDLPYAATDFSYTVGVVPGLAVMLGCALVLVRAFIGGEKQEGGRIAGVLLALGALMLLGATQAFPWEWACSLPRPYSTFFKQIQYPWRLVGAAMPMLAFCAAWGYMKEERTRSQALCLIAALCVVFAGHGMQMVVQDVPLLEKESFCDTRIEQYEYTYERTEKSALAPGEIAVLDAPAYQVREYSKRGTNMSFTLDAPQGLSGVEVPLLYYPGYRAEANGESCRVAMGENNVIRLYGVPGGENIAIRVWYEAPAVWQASLGVSAAGAALLGVLLAAMKRRRA